MQEQQGGSAPASQLRNLESKLTVLEGSILSAGERRYLYLDGLLCRHVPLSRKQRSCTQQSNKERFHAGRSTQQAAHDMEEASAKLARSTASQVAAALDEFGRTALPGSPSDNGQISAAVDRLDARTEVPKDDIMLHRCRIYIPGNDDAPEFVATWSTFLWCRRGQSAWRSGWRRCGRGRCWG